MSFLLYKHNIRKTGHKILAFGKEVVSWIDSLVNKYKVRNIRFADELFVLSPKRVEMLCDLLIEREYDLNIWAYGRVDTIGESLLKKT